MDFSPLHSSAAGSRRRERGRIALSREDVPVNREAESLEQQLEARDPDVRLMVQVRADIPGAFEALVQRYQNRLVGILFHLVGSLEEAEDLCQEVFLRIYKARKGYRPRAKFST